IAPYGAVINEVSDPTQANVTLSMNTTSSLGGAAQGVLGCTTDADQVTMIQGWSWYAGADPTQVSAGQNDFETAVMHELGHVLGLGHRPTPILNPAVSSRIAPRQHRQSGSPWAPPVGIQAVSEACRAPGSRIMSGPDKTQPGYRMTGEGPVSRRLPHFLSAFPVRRRGTKRTGSR